MNVADAALATYRLQLNEQFRIEDADRLVPYLSRLGITHVYSSPLLRARSGSAHGYDVVDPKTIHPGIGDEHQLRQWASALRAFGMGLILDIVPNHMATSSTENPYWHDVLMYGPSAEHASWFDVDWRIPDRLLWGRVLIPVLGAPLVRVLQQDQLTLIWEAGRFRIRYFDHVFPLDPATLPGVILFGLPSERDRQTAPYPAAAELRSIVEQLQALPGRNRRRRGDRAFPLADAEHWQVRLAQLIASSPRTQQWAEQLAADFGHGEPGRIRLRKLLQTQNYRLVFWRRAARAINYRRFFDINDLVSVRQEDPQVFEQTHETVLRWLREGLVDGLRIDHLDGLRDPRGYLLRLRESIAAGSATGAGAPLYVEKILAREESLPTEWPIQGTTGYEFLNQVESLLISPQGYPAIVNSYLRMLKRRTDFQQFAEFGKRRVLRNELSALVGRLADILQRLALEAPCPQPQLTRRQLFDAIVEVAVALPVYRTYIDDRGEIGPEDARFLRQAVTAAAATLQATPAALQFVCEVLLLEGKSSLPAEVLQQRIDFIERFQQLSGPAAAKGIEDTALYAFVPLASRNEVGGAPDWPLDDAVDEFHRHNRDRAHRHPQTMLAVTTHDAKRSADLRARLDVLSEIPRAWSRFVKRWRRQNRFLRQRVHGKWAPDSGMEYLFYQALIGIWPAPDPAAAELPFPPPAVREPLCQRLQQYMQKAAREARTRTNWVDPSSDYETALESFIAGCFTDRAGEAPPFLHEINAFVAQIARSGFWNSLSRTVLQLTAPGTPDLYQGDELWNFALVDPDNRAPVDFAHRCKLLDEITLVPDQPAAARQQLSSFLTQPEDGRIKLWIIHQLLKARRDYPLLFGRGSYEPLAVAGPHANHLVAFARRYEHQCTVTVVPRLTHGLTEPAGRPPLGSAAWCDQDRVEIPVPVTPGAWQSLLTGETLSPAAGCDSAPNGRWPVGQLLSTLPVAVLVARTHHGDQP